MSANAQLYEHSPVRLIHGSLEADGTLEYSPEKHVFEVVLPNSGLFTQPEDVRIVLTDRMLDHLELQPDGKLRLQY